MAGRILLQTTIPPKQDDWSIARFGLLTAHLGSLTNADGRPQFDVIARDRVETGGTDPVLATIDDSDFEQLWLFAVDAGDGLLPAECEAISRFRRSGRGLMVTRDHMDLGSSICDLAGIGAAHHFHTRNLQAQDERAIDDPFTSYIKWPNFHSGANGDFQRIEVVGQPHPVLQDREARGETIHYLPAHPHEGAVSAPSEAPEARVIAAGRSKVTGRRFNIAVAFEAGPGGGRAIAQSTFHHFADYNWDPRAGAPSFVDEPAGTGMLDEPKARADARIYAANVARWLSHLV